MAPPPLRSVRFAAGRTYAAAWRALQAALLRAAPGSVRRDLARPRLPAAPVHRRYGLRVGRPVDRFYIERFLEHHSGDVRGRVLEVLDPSYAERFGRGAARIDVLDVDPSNSRATIVGDLASGQGLPRETFDCFICTQTLSLIDDVRAAVAQAHALLAPGGVLLLTVPGISHQAAPAAEAFPDLWRFTKRSVERLLRERFDDVAVCAEGTVAAAAAFLYGIPVDELDAAVLDPHDADYEMVVCARAVRR